MSRYIFTIITYFKVQQYFVNLKLEKEHIPFFYNKHIQTMATFNLVFLSWKIDELMIFFSLLGTLFIILPQKNLNIQQKIILFKTSSDCKCDIYT